MARGDFKADPRALIRAHRQTYVDARTDRQRWQDVAVMEGVPVMVGGGVLFGDLRLSSATSVGLLTVCGLMGALLFGVLLQVLARAMDFSDGMPEPSLATSSHAAVLRELAANAGYASMVCILAAVAFTFTSVAHGVALRAGTTIGVALGVHLVLVLLMVMKRVFALTVERLNRARSGADRPVEPPRRLTG